MQNPYDLASAVQYAVRITVATRVSGFLASVIASPTERALVVLSATTLIVDFQRHGAGAIGWTATAAVGADLALAVSASTLLSMLVVHGAANVPLNLAHGCVFLIVGETLSEKVLGRLASGFLSNAQYMFAGILTDELLAMGVPLLAFIAAATMSAASSWECWTDSLLAQTFAFTGMGLFQKMLIGTVPAALQLPTVVGFVCFFHPMGARYVYAQSLYNFALYQAAGSLQSILEGLMSGVVALMATLTLSLAAPMDSYAAICQIAGIGVATDLALAAIQHAASVDPFLALACLLIAAGVLLKAVVKE